MKRILSLFLVIIGLFGCLKVDRGYIGGYIRGSAIALVHGQVEYRRRCFRVEIWQMLS